MPSLYVHVPFCVQKCDYCAFYSHSLLESSEDLRSEFLEGLELEMEMRKIDAPQGVSSLFIGGGTPTALGDVELERIMEMMHRHFQFTQGAEKTVEGNPGTITPSKLKILRSYGINRFSLGVQSFDDELLKTVGRIHSGQQARRAIQLLRTHGFDNLNLDLMFGLPGQNLSAWQASLEEALTYSPEHLSLYGLMLEEGTPLYTRYHLEVKETETKEKLATLGEIGGEIVEEYLVGIANDDLQAAMYEWAVERLEVAGYIHYETSNFAQPGYECQHNLGYWRGDDYLGFGPGGVSFLDKVRWKNMEHVPNYLACLQRGDAVLDESGVEVLSQRECMAERMILGLRLMAGVDIATFVKDFGVDPRDIYRDVLECYKHRSVFSLENGYIRLNPKYAFVANSILQEFV